MPMEKNRPTEPYMLPRKSLSSSELIQSFNSLQPPTTNQPGSLNNKVTRFLTSQSTIPYQTKTNRTTSQSRIGSFFDHSHNFLPSWPRKPQSNAIGNCKVVPKSKSSSSIADHMIMEEVAVDVNNINAKFDTLLNELNMNAGQRTKLQQLSSSRKLFLIKQNEQLKNFTKQPTTLNNPNLSQKQNDQLPAPEPAVSEVDQLMVRTPSTDSATTLPVHLPLRLSASMSKISTNKQPNQNRRSKVGSMAIEYDFMTWQQNYQLGSDRDKGYGNLLGNSALQGSFDERGYRARERERDTPYYYVERIKNKHLSLDVLLETLISLRVLLSTMQVYWIDEFVNKANDGLSAIAAVLDRMEERKRRRMSGAKCCDKENKVQLECIRCLRALLNTECGFQELIQHRSMITRIAQSSLYHPRPRSKTDIPKSHSGSSMASFGSDTDVSPAATKLFTQTLDLFTALCQKNRTGYTVIMETMSTIPYENYRFEHLMMALRSPACQDPDDLLPGTSTEWEYKDSAFAFVNAIIEPLDQIEDRMILQSEMKRRGLDERIETLLTSSPPDSIKERIQRYMDRRSADMETFGRSVRMKRQSVWHMHPSEMVMQELQRFSVNPELEFLVIDCISNILSIGKQAQNKEADIWAIINIFTSAMGKAVNQDYQSALKSFILSAQPIVGKVIIDPPGHEEVAASINELEELQSLRDMVSDNRVQLLQQHDTLVKIRKEKNELLMKLSKAQGELSAKQQTIAELQGKLEGVNTCNCTAVPRAGTPEVNGPIAVGPPPPPPPPPPLHLRSPALPQARSSPILTSANNRHSKYHHPVDVNLYFSSLQSLVETSQSMLPSTNKQSNRGSYQKRDSLSTIDKPKDEACAIPRSTTKQFFWSKLTRERIQDTVWGDILLIDRRVASENKPQSGAKGSDVMLMSAKVNLDIGEIENLFGAAQRKDQGGAEYSKAQMKRKSPVITLLEFNRANSIAIMLARLKISYADIRDAIWNIDDEKLNIDNLKAIKQYIPTKEEIQVVKDFDGDPAVLGDAERYFRLIMFIPRLSDRISCMILRRRFRQEMTEILPDIRTIRQATMELKMASKFKKVLQIILMIGNYLNCSTMRGNAYGFKLEALMKMADTKAHNSADAAVPTLLHYLVRVLINTAPLLIDFKQELPHLQAASKLSAVSLHASINTLNAGLTHMEQEIQKCARQKKSATEIDRFHDAMESFLLDAKPILSKASLMMKELDDGLRRLYIYYGEDPSITKSEEFFGMLHSFANAFTKAHREVKEADERIVRSQIRQHKQNTSPYSSSVNPVQCNFEQVIKELSCHRLVRKHRERF